MNGIQVLWAMVQAYWFPLLLILFGFAILVRALLIPRAFTPVWIVPDQWKRDYIDQYNTGAIRDLLKDAFTNGDELKEFCQDRPAFRPVIRRVSARPSLTDLVSAVIDYCQSRILFDQLLEDVRKFNPRQYERYGDELYLVDATAADAVRLSWRDLPTLSRLPRYGVMGVGGALVATGLVWIMLASVSLAPPATLIGLSYMVEDWNPQLLDLRTASSSGIPASTGEALQFFDLWLAVPEDAPGYTVKAEIYAGEELIGTTSSIALIGDKAYPGTAQISEVLVEKYNYDTVPAAWRVQQGWDELSIKLITERGNKAVASTETEIRLAPGGDSRFFNPPLLSFASVVYSINDGPPLVLDLRNAQEMGFGASLSDTLAVLDIWYSSSADADQTVAAEGFLSSGEFDSPTDRSTGPDVIQGGIHRLADVSEFTWEVPADREKLILWLLRRGTGRSTVMDELEIPLGGQGNGLVPAGQEPLAASLTGLRYLIRGEVDPRMVDLRTASTSGIPVEAGQPLQFFDLWAWVPQDAPGDIIQVEVYANGEQIGYTEGQPMIPGAMQLGDIIIGNHVHDEFSDAWQVQDDWAELLVFLVTYGEGGKVGKSYMTIRLDPEGTAWLWDPPNLSFSAVVYSINDGPQMVLDLRQSGKWGLNASQGDRVTLHEVWYHSNANSRDPRVELEAYLDSQGSDWSLHKYAVDDIYWGVNQLGDLPSPSWDVPADDDALVLLLSRIGEGGNVIMQALWLPFGVEDSPGLVPVSEGVLWPFDRSTFMDFERDSDLEDWSGEVQRSSDQAFSGSQALQVTVQVTDTSPFEGIVFWQKEFEADGVALHYYLPSAPGVEITEIDFCIVPGWPCKYLDRTRDQWHTIVLDFSVWPEDADPPFDERELSALGFQGQITAPGSSEPISYTFYVDAIQIFDHEAP